MKFSNKKRKIATITALIISFIIFIAFVEIFITGYSRGVYAYKKCNGNPYILQPPFAGGGGYVYYRSQNSDVGAWQGLLAKTYVCTEREAIQRGFVEKY